MEAKKSSQAADHINKGGWQNIEGSMHYYGKEWGLQTLNSTYYTAHYTMVHYLTLSSASSARSTPRTLLEFCSVLGGMSLPMRQQKPCCGASCPAMVLPETCDPQGLPAPMPKKRVSIPWSLCHCEMEIIFTWLWLSFHANSFLLFLECKILPILPGVIPVVAHSI